MLRGVGGLVREGSFIWTKEVISSKVGLLLTKVFIGGEDVI